VLNISDSECGCSLTYSVCKVHAPYFNVIYGLSGTTICEFGKNVIEYKMIALVFSTKLNSKFLIFKKNPARGYYQCT
jgi:hypothetical protein